MADESGFVVGRILAKLGFAAGDDDQIAKWRRERDQAQRDAAKDIKQNLGAQVDDREFKRYHEQLAKVRAESARKEAYKVKLGADYDERAFRAFERDSERARKSTKSFSDELDGLNVKLPKVGSVMGLLKWPAMIAGAGMAAQAVSAATAGVTALGSALAPLSGALAAYPALGSAAAQGLGVFKLGTAGLADGLKAAAQGGKAWEDELKKLTPQQAQFVRDLKPVVDNVKGLQAVARENMLPGLERGALAAAKNVGVLRPIVEDTAKAIGHLADRAGQLVGSRAFGRDLQTQGERNVRWIERGGNVALHLADALRNITLAAGPLVNWMTLGAERGARLVDTFIGQARESGKLAGFFHQTQVEMSRVVRIGADVATAFFNIARAGKPLGDDILVSIVRAADNFRKWTESARGQNAIADYFRQARPAIFELGRLLHDVTIDFLKLGQGNQVAPLIRTIRVDLLPRFVALVDATTKAFGPPMLNAIKQVAILFTTLGGTNGPLVVLVKLVGKVAEGINKATDAIPGLGSAISSVSTVASLYAALRIASTLSGLSRIIKLIKDARAAGAVTAGAQAAGAAGTAGTAGRVGGVAAAGGIGAAVAGAIPTAAIAAGAVVLVNVIKDANKHTAQWTNALKSVRFEAAQLAKRSNFSGLDDLSRGIAASGKAAGLSSREIDSLRGTVARFSRQANHDFGGVGNAIDQARKNFADFRRTGSNNMEGIKQATQQNMHFIRRTLGEDSAAGKEALARNFRLARTAIRQAMADGRISVKDGLAEIQQLMRAELKQYGITGGVASSIIKHGNIKGSDAPAAGHARGGWVAKARHAVGGWIGRRGMVSGDVVPIGPNALAAYGEYDAHGPGGERAILNRHQAPIAEAALAAGGYPGLDHLPPGRQLPVLERALAPMGGLDRLFQAITRPHNFAVGGRFQGGGGIYSKQQLMQLWVQAGGPASVANIAAAIALAESGGNANARNSIGATGLWQIYNGPNTDPGLRDPVANARAAVAKYRAAHGFTPWTTYTGADTPGHEKTYLRFLGAGAAVPTGGSTTPVVPATASPITAPRTGLSGLLGAIVQATLDRGAVGATRHVQDLLDASGATAGPGGPGPAGGPSGIGTYEGIPMARWVIAALNYARSRGAGGHPTSGYRSPGQVISGPVVAPQGHSEHQGTQYPHGAVDFGGPFDPGARSVKMGVVNATSSFKWPLLAPIGFRDDGHASGTGHALGGFLQRFASGGRKRRHPIVRPHVTASAPQPTSRPGHPALQTARLSKLQVARIADYDQASAEVADLETAYGQRERYYNLTDEILVDPDTGQVNVDAVMARAAEIQGLIDIRNQILRAREKMRAVADRIVSTYRLIIGRLKASLTYAKRKDRSGIKSQISQYQDDLTNTWLPNLHQVITADIPDTKLDILELSGEKASILGTQAQPQAADTTGGGDTAGVDTAAPADAAPAPPTAADIAAAAYQDVQAYLGQQRDMLSTFAGNAYTPGQAFGAGGVFSGSPDLQGAALGALRGFGGGDLAGSLGAGRGGPVIVVQPGGAAIQYQAAAAPDPPTFISQMRFQVENGFGG